MKKLTLLLCGSLLGLTATTAFAAGVNLAWDNCLAAGGGEQKRFDCNTNIGSATMVASVVAPADIVAWQVFDNYINFYSQTGVYPTWWQLRNQTGQTNQCRFSSLSVSPDFTGAPYLGACLDVFRGQGAGGTYYYTLQGAMASMRISFAVQPEYKDSLVAGAEYFTARATINYAKTVGTGSCDGCCDAMLIELVTVRILQPSTPGHDVDVTNPAVRNWIWWNHDNPDCGAVVSTRAPTWGAIKALYR